MGVEDWDRLSGNDFMGQLKIDLSVLRFDRGVMRGWFKLRHERPEADSPPGSPPGSPTRHHVLSTPGDAVGYLPLGEIELELRWVHNADAELPPLEPLFRVRFDSLRALVLRSPSDDVSPAAVGVRAALAVRKEEGDLNDDSQYIKLGIVVL